MPRGLSQACPNEGQLEITRLNSRCNMKHMNACDMAYYLPPGDKPWQTQHSLDSGNNLILLTPSAQCRAGMKQCCVFLVTGLPQAPFLYLGTVSGGANCFHLGPRFLPSSELRASWGTLQLPFAASSCNILGGGEGSTDLRVEMP